jgi:hypothetical protein
MTEAGPWPSASSADAGGAANATTTAFVHHTARAVTTLRADPVDVVKSDDTADDEANARNAFPGRPPPGTILTTGRTALDTGDHPAPPWHVSRRRAP